MKYSIYHNAMPLPEGKQSDPEHDQNKYKGMHRGKKKTDNEKY